MNKSSTTPATVSIARIGAYEEDAVLDAMRRCLKPLGGIESFVRQGQNVLLKPNLIGAFPAERACTTHPSVVRAAALLCLQAGAKVSIGDSPGIGSMEGAMARCGVAGALRDLDIAHADFHQEAEFENSANVVGRKLMLAKAVADADVIITLPKLKTHSQMVFTGALKNQFGLVLGAKKAHYHYRLKSREWLAQLIIDINRTAKPALAIMDGIVAMEGMGPAGGEPRALGAILAGADLSAVDAIACKLINLDPATVPLLQAAAQSGFGATYLEHINLVGDAWEELVVCDFKKIPELLNILRLLPLPAFLIAHLRRIWAPRPRIISELCIKCMACHRGCPVDPPAIDPKNPTGHFVNDDTCIRCYCCHEFCPEKAITFKRSWLHRLLIT